MAKESNRANPISKKVIQITNLTHWYSHLLPSASIIPIFRKHIVGCEYLHGVMGVSIASNRFVGFISTLSMVKLFLFVPDFPTYISYDIDIKIIISKKNNRTIFPESEVQRTVTGMKRILRPSLVLAKFFCPPLNFSPL